MRLDYKEFLIAFGAACCCAQTLLDRSGIILYGGAVSSFDQSAIWASMTLSAIASIVAMHALGKKRGGAVLGGIGLALTLAGCLLLLLLYQQHGSSSAMLDITTLLLTCSRVPILQLWVYKLVDNPRTVRLTLSMIVLTAAIVLLTTSLPTPDMHLTGYLLASVAAAGLVLVPTTASDPESEPERTPEPPARETIASLGAKTLALFALVQIAPTVISGSISTIEMYTPISLASWQQLASFASGALLLVLFAFSVNAKRIPDTMLVLVPILLAICMIIPLSAEETFSTKPLFILATQFGGAFAILNINRVASTHARLPLHTFAFLGQTLTYFGLFIGSVLSRSILQASGIDTVSQGMYTSIAFAGMLVLLAGLSFFVLKEQPRHPAGEDSSTSASKAPSASKNASDPFIPASIAENADAEAIAAISSRYGLTARESDMLMYLAAGFSRQRIAADLFIGEATVKTHINNLYTKLDVHKRDELLDLVNEHKGTLRR